MNKRPVNLDLMTMKFPPMAIASILHRLSGIALFLGMPLVLYLLSLSLYSPEGFEEVQICLAQWYWKLGIWVFLSALTYHLFAGIRHIIMDFGFGESLLAGRRSALAVILLTFISFILLGIWLW